MDIQHFTDILGDADEIGNSQPLSLSLTPGSTYNANTTLQKPGNTFSRNERPARRSGQQGEFRSVEEIEPKYRDVFTYPYFNLVQSRVIDDALYSDKSMVVCAPTGSGKTVVFEMAIVQLLMELDDNNYTGDFKIIYMAPVKAVCTERLSEWYPKFTKLGLMCIEVTGDTNVDFSQLMPYRIIITTPEKWDMLTRRWREHKSLVEVIKLFLIDEVHILNDESRGPVLEAVVSRMKTIETSSQSAHRIEQLQKQYQSNSDTQDQQTNSKNNLPLRIRFVAISATVSNPEDVAAWLGTRDKPAVFYKFGDECRPVKLKRVVEGYPCTEGTSIFKFDIILNYKLWPVIQKYHDGKPTLIFCNTRKSVTLTADTLSRELTISFTPEQQAKLAAVASTIKNKKLQALVQSGVGCHHAGLLYEERQNIEEAFRNRDLPILITTTTLAMGVNLPAHLVIIKNTQQYVNGAYQEYSISTVLQMVGRAGRPQFDTEATAVIMTRLQDKPRYQALVGGDEPLQSYLHKRLAENLNSEAALETVCDVAQCVQWLCSTFLSVRATKDPKRYLGLPPNAPPALISKKIEELCVKAMNGLASSGLITMDEASCIESTEAGRLMSVFYLDLETMKYIMKIEGNETLEKLLWIVCESHELADMHLRVEERRTLNTLNRNNASATIRFPMKGKICTRQMKLSCIIQAVLGCLPIADPSLNQEAMRVMRIAQRVCKCLVAYVTRPDITMKQSQFFNAVLNAVLLAKCIEAHLWENSPYVSKQLKGIGPTFSTLLASAGKVNFTLLEESHPRDLERIMNKAAPAGNVLRKQVGLLPKYQLTANPVDEKRISIQLMLVNHHQLAENRDQWTAGNSHKCYVVIGDSENYLLLFTSFSDKDLINVYDGTITYEVTRKHNFEHKILIHCISSNWVGIDAQCDYLFQNIEAPFSREEHINPISSQDTIRKSAKQTCITDVYKERKRKNNEIDITESKEKRKRDSALVQKFKLLKDSFEATSKELKKDLHKSAQMSNIIIHEMIQPENSNNQSKEINNRVSDGVLGNLDDHVFYPTANDQDSANKSRTAISMSKKDDYPELDNLELLDDEDNFEVDDRINTLLNEIESEILEVNNDTQICANRDVLHQNNTNKSPTTTVQSSFFTKQVPKMSNLKAQSANSIISHFPKCESYTMINKSFNEKRKPKNRNTKSNYSFIDTIEKKAKADNDNNIPINDSGFSDTIKSQIERFLQNTTKTNVDKVTVIDPIGCTEPTQQQKQPIKTTNTRIMTEYCTTEHDIPLSSENSSICKETTKVNTSTTKNAHKIRTIDRSMKGIEEDYNKATREADLKHIEHDFAKTEPEGNLNEAQNILGFNDDQSTPTESKIKNMSYNKENINLTEAQYNYNDPKNNEVEQNSKRNTTNVIGREELLRQTTLQIDANKCLIPVMLNKKIIENVTTSNNFDNNSINNCDQHLIKHFNTTVKTLPIEDRIDTKMNKDISRYKSLYNNNERNLHRTSRCLASTFNALIPLGDRNSEIMECNGIWEDEFNKCTMTLTKSEHKLPQPSYSLTSDNLVNRNSKFDQQYTTEDSSKNQKAKDCIKRYMYSATKIDVCTKNLPNHKVQIIRKLKLDVDVTEIVSEYDSKKKREPSEMFKDDEKYRDVMTNPIPDSHKIPRQKIQVQETQNHKKYLTYTEIPNGKQNKYLTTTKQINSSHYVDNSNDTFMNTKCLPYIDVNYTKDNVSNAIQQSNAPIVDKQKNISKEEVEQYKKYLREIAAASAVKVAAKTDSAAPEKPGLETENVDTENKEQYEQTNSNKIENILQKYSAILRKNNNKTITTDTATENSSDSTLSIPQVIENPKKPYKISEIQNLQIPLPNSLIAVEASRTSRITYSNDNLTNLKGIKQTHEIKTPSISENTSEIKQNTNCEDNLIADILECHSPVDQSISVDISQLELGEDYDLDQSMLNPKTLLEQYYSKDKNNGEDNEIIPPPVEFCDNDNEATYSPVKLQECFTQEVSQDIARSYLQDTISKYEQDKSIFEEDIHSVLTPSVEIETWTLSRDTEENNTDFRRWQIHSQSNFNTASDNDAANKDYFKINTNLNKSCTVMRRNAAAAREFSPKPFDTSTRFGKLGHFKFTSKNKLKM